MVLKIAILVNHPPSAHFHSEIQQAFTDSFTEIAPEAEVQFFDPYTQQLYPDASKFDLIILSGGKADACASDPWILTMLEFVRTTVRETPTTKILGICWGHQALIRALGGQVQAVPSGPIAGLVRVPLTDEGKKFFPSLASKGSFTASQFHVREVANAPDEFIPLAENNEAFVSRSNKLLSFQAHPEISGKFAKDIIWDDDATYTEGRTAEEIQEMRTTIGDDQDGLEMLRRVLQWVEE